MALIIDSYQDTASPGAERLNGTITKSAQSFNASASVELNRVHFYLARVGTLTGNLTAVLYAHSGTFGTSSVPTGSALATSTTVDVTTLSTSPTFTWEEFTFTTPFTLTKDTKYTLSCESDAGGDGTNYARVAKDQPSGHAGNQSDFGASWTASSIDDQLFIAFFDGADSLPRRFSMMGF